MKPQVNENVQFTLGNVCFVLTICSFEGVKRAKMLMKPEYICSIIHTTTSVKFKNAIDLPSKNCTLPFML